MAKKTPKVNKEPEVKVATGAVYYTDGGCAPNPGHCGYGVHGYTYTSDTPKKGAGFTTHNVTTNGYIKKKDSGTKDVDVVNYIDSYGYIKGLGTNNLAEVAAAYSAINHATKNNIKNVTLITDSKFTINCIETWIDNWKNNGWTKSDGRPVNNPKPYKQLSAAIDSLNAYGGVIQCGWVEGHKGHAGNTQADLLATLGVKFARQTLPPISKLPPSDGIDNVDLSLILSDAQKYHKPTVEKPKMLFFPVCLFWANEDGLNVNGYYLCSKVKDEAAYGNKAADMAYAYYEPILKNEKIDEIKKYHVDNQICYEKIVRIHLDELYTAKNQQLVDMFGQAVYKPNKKGRVALKMENGAIISTEFDPVRNARTAYEHAVELKGLANVIDDLDIIKTDITDLLYLRENDKCALRKELGSGVNEVKVAYGYMHHQGNIVMGTTKLRMDTELPSRNALKRIEDINPQVFVLTWNEDVRSYRYGVYVKTDEGFAIIAAIHANLRIMV